jgi:phage terminase small subunit
MVTPRSDDDEALTAKQELFLKYYIETLNGAKAARRAGYAEPYNVSAGKLMARPSVKKALQVRLMANRLTRELIEHYLGQLVRSSIGDFLRIDQKTGKVDFDLRQAEESGSLRQVKRMSIRNGEITSVELVDLLKATELLSRLAGLFDEPPASSATANDRSFWEGS